MSDDVVRRHRLRIRALSHELTRLRASGHYGRGPRDCAECERTRAILREMVKPELFDQVHDAEHR